MDRTLRKAAAATVLTLAGGLFLASDTARAQGPYGRNTYEDFPFNQGSLFYRPLKPKPRPRPRVVRPRVVQPAPVPYQGGYGTAQPVVPAPATRPRYYYYYPAYPR
jgi:hypothetical protein